MMDDPKLPRERTPDREAAVRDLIAHLDGMAERYPETAGKALQRWTS